MVAPVLLTPPALGRWRDPCTELARVAGEAELSDNDVDQLLNHRNPITVEPKRRGTAIVVLAPPLDPRAPPASAEATFSWSGE
jgi:hypothetical protein